MTRTAAVIQSNYLPWKGYFDIIHDVDVFVFFDHVQYTKGDWRNRNRIKTARGLSWLTVPVGTPWHSRICDVALPSGKWATQNWQRIREAYEAAPYFATYASFFEDLYRSVPFQYLSELNQYLVRVISRDMLGLRTEFVDSRAFGAAQGTRFERLLSAVRHTGANRFVSGPAAKSYLDPARFAEEGIEVVWKDYSGYPEYPQLHPPFGHPVSIIDLLFNAGPQAAQYIWGWRNGR